MSRTEVAQKMMRGAQMLEVKYEQSYYNNKNRLVRGLEMIEEAEDLASDCEEISRSETRNIERIKFYVEKRVYGDEELEEIENAVRIITNGLAWALENPEEFEGYSERVQKYADMIGLQIKKKNSKTLSE